MDRSLTLNFNFNTLLYRLFCLFAFTIPFELAFEILFDIETVFKPFRLVALAIIVVYGLKTLKFGLSINTQDRSDLFLYFMIIYGVIASAFRMITGVFNYNIFYNDLLLLGLLIILQFVIKSTPLTRQQMQKMFKYLVVGVTINCFYIFYEFFILGIHGREAGFIDNPNYGSLGVAVVLVYLLMRFGNLKSFGKQLIYVIYMLFMLYIFIIEGSRTGLAVLLISLVFVFYYYSLTKKLFLLFGGGLLAIFFVVRSQQGGQFAGGPLHLVSRVANDINTGEADVRFEVWRGLFDMLETEGYLGMGIGQYKAQFAHYYRDYPNGLISRIVSRGYYLSTHNDYLAILTDYGLPGLALYILFIYFTMKRLQARLLDYEGDEEDLLFYRFSTIIFLCLITFGLASENFHHPLFWFLMAFSTKEIVAPKTNII